MPNFPPRRAEPHQAFDFHDSTGAARTIHADADGVVRPKDDAEAQVLDLFGLPHAQPATIAKARAARRSKTRAKAGKPVGKVVTATGEVDTRGPGAPADEPGVTDVKEG